MLLATLLLFAQDAGDRGKCEPGSPAHGAFTVADYPKVSLRDDEEAIVGYTVQIDAEGCVSACAISRSSGHKEVDDATCLMLTRLAQYRPRRDVAGKRTGFTVSGEYFWLLPEPMEPGSTPPEPIAYQSWVTSNDYPKAALRADEPGQVVFRLDVDSRGGVTGCKLRSSSGSATLDSATCPLMTARAQFRPARNSKGRPIASRWSSRFNWSISGD